MYRIVGLFLLVFLAGCFCSAQSRYRIVSYNVENLFDTRNDPDTWDDDFTPFGNQHWNETKYTDKLLKLSRALKATGEGEWPALIGLCEVENRQVVLDLILKTSLKEGNYKVVHRDSPDKRGIDVALLYRPEKFELLEEDFLPVTFPEELDLATRDILYARGILGGKDTLHVFVCHFPSMSGGEAASEWKRERAAFLLKEKIRKIQALRPEASIIVLGDLNGKANRPAQTEVLGTEDSGVSSWKDTVLYNTGYYLLHRDSGSYKYKGNWQTIDHILVSGALLKGKSGLKAAVRLHLFSAPFLLEEDKSYYGFKPYRTYLGPRYHGGYSDHLPIYLDVSE